MPSTEINETQTEIKRTLRKYEINIVNKESGKVSPVSVQVKVTRPN